MRERVESARPASVPRSGRDRLHVAAAARPHPTQPGITRRVQSLESRLGVELLDRQSKPLRPTQAGRDAYALGRRVLASIDDLLDRVSPQAEACGEWRLGVPPFLSEVVLAASLDCLRAEFPHLSIRVTAAWSPGLMQMLEKSTLDAAVVVVPDGVPPPAPLRVQVLSRESALVVAARLSPLRRGDLGLEELAAHAWVLNQDGCGMRSAIGQALERRRLPFDVAVEAFGAELQLSLVARGVGIGITIPSALRRSAFRKQVRALSVPEFENGLCMWLLHAPGLCSGRLALPLARFRSALVEITRQRGIGGGQRPQ
ncbi:LysR family transcriptional regulator [Xanthomonas theicola]|nr:LysR family transcriptional regulator [Xanthomonas theicola]